MTQVLRDPSGDAEPSRAGLPPGLPAGVLTPCGRSLRRAYARQQRDASRWASQLTRS